MNPTIHQLIHDATWDGTPRLDLWMVKCLGTPDTPAARVMSRLFIRGMVARATLPRCEFPYVLVIQGPQGCGKSRLLHELAGGHVVQLLQLPTTQAGCSAAALQMRDTWIAELTELTIHNAAEGALLKAFAAQSADRYRVPYSNGEVTTVPRSCVIAATTCDASLNLQGNRRFWVVQTTEANNKRLRLQRDQLFAEAAHQLRLGESQMPTAAEYALLTEPATV